YISKAGHEALVEQFHFDRLRGTPQSARELIEMKVLPEWFRPEIVQWSRIQCESPEITRVFVNELLFVERKDHRRVFRFGLLAWQHIHIARHAEVAEQGERGVAAPQSEDQIFGPPLQGNKARPLQHAHEVAFAGWRNHAETAYRHIADRFACNTRAQFAHCYFHFRQFRHKYSSIEFETRSVVLHFTPACRMITEYISNVAVKILDTTGYAGAGLLMALESMIAPVPSEAV